jgi:hypothetical protein
VEGRALAPCVHHQAAALKDTWHRKVVRDDLLRQFAQARLASDRHQMSYQHRTNSLGLIFVDKRRRLGLAWFDDVVAAAHDQGRVPFFVRDRDQRDMLDKAQTYRRVCSNVMLDPKSYSGVRRDRTCCDEKLRVSWDRVDSRAALVKSLVDALVGCSLCMLGDDAGYDGSRQLFCD